MASFALNYSIFKFVVCLIAVDAYSINLLMTSTSIILHSSIMLSATKNESHHKLMHIMKLAAGEKIFICGSNLKKSEF